MSGEALADRWLAITGCVEGCARPALASHQSDAAKAACRQIAKRVAWHRRNEGLSHHPSYPGQPTCRGIRTSRRLFGRFSTLL